MIAEIKSDCQNCSSYKIGIQHPVKTGTAIKNGYDLRAVGQLRGKKYNRHQNEERPDERSDIRNEKDKVLKGGYRNSHMIFHERIDLLTQVDYDGNTQQQHHDKHKRA